MRMVFKFVINYGLLIYEILAGVLQKSHPFFLLTKQKVCEKEFYEVLHIRQF